MSIGALSKATGVPADTLRTWERRYGFPSAERTESGHRRYSLQTLARLRLVVRALSLGHRPSTVLSADSGELEQLVAAAAPYPEPSRARPPARDAGVLVERWLEHVERFEGRALDREMHVAAAEFGGLPFLEYCAGPFLHELGERWAAGTLSVAHEHFASERVREFLAQRWRPLSDASTGPVIVCATPSGEQHVLGLHLAALALALHNARLVFLGADAPASEIARAVHEHGAEAVVLSAAQGIDGESLAREIARLIAALPADTPIVVGGSGLQRPVPGVTAIGNLFDLVEWLAAAWPRRWREGQRRDRHHGRRRGRERRDPRHRSHPAPPRRHRRSGRRRRQLHRARAGSHRRRTGGDTARRRAVHGVRADRRSLWRR
jgi:MerR family transcriptional regulator, light-induced transcriptional regulator